MVHLHEPLQHGRLGLALLLEVHGQLDPQAVRQEPPVAVALHHLAAHQLGVEGRGLAEDVVHAEDLHLRRLGPGPLLRR